MERLGYNVVWTLLALIVIIQGITSSAALKDEEPYKVKKPHLIHNSGVHLFFLNQEPLQFQFSADETKPITIMPFPHPAAVYNENPPPNLYHHMMTYLDDSIKRMKQYEETVSREQNELEVRGSGSQNSLLDDLPPIENTDEQLKQLIRVKRNSDRIIQDTDDILNTRDYTVAMDKNTSDLPQEHNTSESETELFEKSQNDNFVSTVEEMIALIDKELKHKTKTILKRFTRDKAQSEMGMNDTSYATSKENITTTLDTVTSNFPLPQNTTNYTVLPSNITENISTENIVSNIALPENITNNSSDFNITSKTISLSGNITSNITLPENVIQGFNNSENNTKILYENATTTAFLLEGVAELNTNKINLSTKVNHKEIDSTTLVQSDTTVLSGLLKQPQDNELEFETHSVINQSDSKELAYSTNETKTKDITEENNVTNVDNSTASTKPITTSALLEMPTNSTSEPLLYPRLQFSNTPSGLTKKLNATPDQVLSNDSDVNSIRPLYHIETTTPEVNTSRSTTLNNTAQTSIQEIVRIVTIDSHQALPGFKRNPHRLPDEFNEEETISHQDNDDWTENKQEPPENQQAPRQDILDTLSTDPDVTSLDDDFQTVHPVQNHHYFSGVYPRLSQKSRVNNISSPSWIIPFLYLLLAVIIGVVLFKERGRMSQSCPYFPLWQSNRFRANIPFESIPLRNF